MLMKLEFCRQILEKILKYEISEDLGAELFRADGRKDGQT